MTRNRSLDEFLGGEERAEADDDESTDASRPEPDETESKADETDYEPEPDEPGPDADDDGAVEPAVSTYEFTPDGEACGACGTVVETRWRDERGLVCPDCKQW